ncbi:hypothetical protein EXIGLDRAFT_73174 [Exidia glandulosa HHB12029]|uniref:Uncharacterized protein n=1 Tax=Exidia glandulosa HHB12029 TaxID=1314781 RepID=A0A165HUZ2_EXIGL|nr:hypothetical protein EXIGLDRAFT_73174 [Exidia glandulosa HHB12029]
MRLALSGRCLSPVAFYLAKSAPGCGSARPKRFKSRYTARVPKDCARRQFIDLGLHMRSMGFLDSEDKCVLDEITLGAFAWPAPPSMLRGVGDAQNLNP